MDNIIKLRIFLWGLLLLAVSWFLYMAVVPFGEIVYSNDFKGKSYFIGAFTPRERIETEEGTVRIIGDPVYFNLRTSRTFDTAKLLIRYRRFENGNEPGMDSPIAAAPIVEAGILKDRTLWRYDLKPLENRIIDRVALVWEKTGSGNLTLFQKEKKYDSVEDLLQNPPDPERIAVYNYDLDIDYVPPAYATGTGRKIINTPLRGAHEFFTYLKDEDLDFSFNFLDINQNNDPDPISVFVYYRDKLIDSRSLADDGIAAGTGEQGLERVLDLKLAQLPEGAYKVEIKVNDDIIINSIETGQSKLSFLHKLWPVGTDKEAIELYTDSRCFQAKTANPKSLQKIRAGEAELDLVRTYEQFELCPERSSSTAKLIGISIEKSDIVISGDGVFSFSPVSHINPRLKKADRNLDVKAENIEYIIARYSSPVEEAGWYEARAEFDLRGAYREKGAYSFLLSASGLKADDDIDDALIIDKIEIELRGKNLFKKLKEYFY